MITDDDRKQFLMDLDESDQDVTDWEVEFINSMLARMPVSFSDKQKDCIDRMIIKYDDKI